MSLSSPINALRSIFLPPAGEELPEARELHRWGMISFWTVMALFLALLLWAIMAPLHGAVVARGQLRVASESKVVQHQEGGIVKEILVKNGSRVKQGQPLMVLEDMRVDANYDILDQQYVAELAKTARLEAERDFLEEINFPAYLVNAQGNPLVADILRKERVLFRQRRHSLMLQVNILKKQIEEADREISGTDQQVVADANGQKAAKAELTANETLLRQGFISAARMSLLERSLSDYESRLGEHLADLSRARQKQNDVRLRIEELRNNYRETAATELKESTIKLNELRERIKPALDTEQRQRLVSPVDGLVMDLRVHTIGAVIGPRDPIMIVVPENQHLVVEARLPVDSISELKIGMMADVRLLAFQQRTTPLVEGKLTYLAADAMADKPGEPPFYAAEVALDAKSIEMARVGSLQPGMPAEIYLRTQSRTVLDYFLAPVTQSLYRAFRER